MDRSLPDLDVKQPTWIEVYGGGPPLPRSWHNSCTIEGSKLVVSGGCTERMIITSHSRRRWLPEW
ncbi:putative kelch-type beta propeller [Helianthus debilis subsp. tardiflorus]